MKISIIGLGYVGFPTMLLLSQTKNKIYGYDINFDLIKSLKSGKYDKTYSVENNISTLYQKQLLNKKLNFDTELICSDVYIICVPTPINKKFKPDTQYIDKAIKSISKIIKKNDLIIIESTVPINYCSGVRTLLNNNHQNMNFYLAYCPERVLPGDTLKEIKNNKRIIGGICKRSSNKAKKIYQSFVNGKIYETTIGISEFTKLSENAYRDTNIAFSNELSILCQKNNINHKDVINFANMHPRVNILKSGIGVGGHCIPVDPWFLIENYNKTFSIIKNARKVNKYKTSFIINDISKKINKINSETKINHPILFLGLTYKPEVGDLRESPAVDIVNKIRKKFNNNIFVHDPHASIKNNLFVNNIKNISFKLGLKKSKTIILLVDHKYYRNIKKKITKIHNFINVSD